MIQRTLASLPLWQFEKLAEYPQISHFISGRPGGVSSGEVGALNLSFSARDARENVLENRRRLAEAVGVSARELFFPSQTHSNHVQLVRSGTRPEELRDTDALITNTPGLCICVMSADCVPLLLYDPVGGAVAAIHAGWRGTVSKIVSRTVEAMRENFGTNPADLVAGIGPSICPEVYEVGEEVILAAEQAFGSVTELVQPTKPGKGLFNLWEANRMQLLSAGIRAENIELAGMCTYQGSDQFFSARKSGNRAGRFAAGILLRP